MSGKRSVLRNVNGFDVDDEKVVTPVKKVKANEASVFVTPEVVKSSHLAAMKELAGSVRSCKSSKEV
jgi:hypothetical protein